MSAADYLWPLAGYWSAVGAIGSAGRTLNAAGVVFCGLRLAEKLRLGAQKQLIGSILRQGSSAGGTPDAKCLRCC